MAYDKKYPEINKEILEFDKGQEDRTEQGFNDLEDRTEKAISDLEIKINGKIVARDHEITLLGGGGYNWWENTPFISVQIIDVLDKPSGVTYSLEIGVNNIYSPEKRTITSYFYRLDNGVRLSPGTRVKVRTYHYV